MEYNHGGDPHLIRNGIIDFSVNINPLGTPEAVERAARTADISRYPDWQCKKLRGLIAEREGVLPDWVIVGNGAAELIYSLMYALKPKTVLIHSPAFSEYAAAAHAAGCGVSDTEGEVEFICNPNNPTGGLTEPRDIAERLNDRFVVVDECFIDFLDEPERFSCAEMIEGHKNLAILRSFTKMYALAGLRLGWLMTSDAELIEKIYCARQPWSVSAPAQAAGEAACLDLKTPERTREYLLGEREYLTRELARLGVDYLPPSANFIAFRSVPDLRERLLERDILIRGCRDFGMENYYRIGIRTRRDNERLVRAMEEAL